MDWCVDSTDTDRRNMLCLHGYRLPLPVTDRSDSRERGVGDNYTAFWQLVVEYEVGNMHHLQLYYFCNYFLKRQLFTYSVSPYFNLARLCSYLQTAIVGKIVFQWHVIPWLWLNNENPWINIVIHLIIIKTYQIITWNLCHFLWFTE